MDWKHWYCIDDDTSVGGKFLFVFAGADSVQLGHFQSIKLVQYYSYNFLLLSRFP